MKTHYSRVTLFHYQKVCESHPGFIDFIKRSWPDQLHTNPLISFGLQLTHLRAKLRVWNWQIFGSFSANIHQTSMEINTLENQLQNQWYADDAHALDVINS